MRTLLAIYFYVYGGLWIFVDMLCAGQLILLILYNVDHIQLTLTPDQYAKRSIF